MRMFKKGERLPRFRVLLTGGGTGGHINPLIAVAEELRAIADERGTDLIVRYMGSAGRFRWVLSQNQIRSQPILGGKFRRYFSLLNFVDIPKLIFGFFQAIFKMFFFMPDVVFSKGGTGALAVIIAARFYRIPVVIHDSDAVPGLTSAITGRMAKTVAISFEEAGKYFEHIKGKVVLTGNPLSRSLFSEQLSQEKAKAYLGFDRKLPLVLVFGGSQGALKINDFILDNISELLEFTQIFHQTGKRYYNTVTREFKVIEKDFPKELLNRYEATDYLDTDGMRTVLTASDIVVARAGAGIITHIAAFGRPSILIPLPNSANDHQAKNALTYGSKGAAVVMEEANLLPHLFVNYLENLFKDPKKLIQMSKAAQKFYKPDAALKIARILLTIKSQNANLK